MPVSGIGPGAETGVRMEEGIRRGYLLAMGIQVWVPRQKSSGAANVADVQKDLPPTERFGLRHILDSNVSRDAAPRPRALNSPESQAAVAGSVAGSFLFSVVGSCLFVDRNPPSRDADACSDLLAALAFVLERRRAEVRTEILDWPPAGVSSDRARMRDALTARIHKLAQMHDVRRIVLMGSVATALLLDWSDEQFSSRSRTAQRIAGIDLPVLVTVGATQLLQDPLSKREAWQDLRHATEQ